MNARLKCGASRITVVALLLAWTHAASGQTFSSGSTGADGALNPGASTTITVRPGGVYNYTTVNIPSGITVTYVRGADNAPVTILASGDVTIAGTVRVDGSNGVTATTVTGSPFVGAAGGPGGFNGGNGGVLSGASASFGHGPGGGAVSGFFRTGTFGAPDSFVSLVPLFGGSGGGGGEPVAGQPFVRAGSGAGGGGAILIASSSRITVSGLISANGGNVTIGQGAFGQTCGGTGSGGAIRLVAGEITGTGALQANKGTENCQGVSTVGPGRARLEAFMMVFTGVSSPVASVAFAPGPVSPGGNPALANVPTLTIASIAGVALPANPGASYFAPDMTLPLGTANPVPVVLTATNTPVGSPTAITVRLLPQGPATSIVVPAADHTGTFASSSATVGVTFPVGQVSVVQAFAAFTLTGQTASLFPLIDGVPVERVLVAATQGQPSTVSLVTQSGKEVRLDQLQFDDQLRVARAWEVLRTTRVE